MGVLGNHLPPSFGRNEEDILSSISILVLLKAVAFRHKLAVLLLKIVRDVLQED